MRRRKVDVRPPGLGRPLLRMRPVTSGSTPKGSSGPQSSAPRVRAMSAGESQRNTFMPGYGDTYIDHLLSWQAGQKEGTQLRPFRKPDHTYKRTDLVRDPRTPGFNSKRDQQHAVRVLNRTVATKNTEGWIGRQGQRRLVSASSQSSLGLLAAKPISELQVELDWRMREELKRPRTSIGSYDASWTAAPWDTVLIADPDAHEHIVSHLEAVQRKKSSTSNEYTVGGKLSNGVPVDARERQDSEVNPQSTSDGKDEEPAGYVDKLYYRVTDKGLDHAAQTLHNEYKHGFASKAGGHIAKRLQVAHHVFPRQYAERMYSEKMKTRLGNQILAVHALFQNRKWVCWCKKVPLPDIIREPYRYMLISREQFEEFGNGKRELSAEEWQRLQMGQKLVGEMPQVVKLLQQHQVAQAIKAAEPTNLEEFPRNDWLGFTSTRERMLELALERADCHKSLFPAASLRLNSRSDTGTSSMMAAGPKSAEDKVLHHSSFGDRASAENWADEIEKGEHSETTNEVAPGSNQREIVRVWEQRSSAQEANSTTILMADTLEEVQEDLDDTHDGIWERSEEDNFCEEKMSQVTVCLGGASLPEACEQQGQGVGNLTGTEGVATERVDTEKAEEEQQVKGHSAPDAQESLRSLAQPSSRMQTLTPAKPEDTLATLDKVSDGELFHLMSCTSSNMRVCDVAVQAERERVRASVCTPGINESGVRHSVDGAPDSSPQTPMHNSQAGAHSALQAAKSHSASSTPKSGPGACDVSKDGIGNRSDVGVGVLAAEATGHLEDQGQGDMEISFNTIDGETGLERGLDTAVLSTVVDEPVLLELGGYDIRLRLTLDDMLQQNAHPTTGRVRNLKWLLLILSQLSADKLLSDAGELGAGLPRQRMPAFAKKWLTLKFGKNKFCEQQLADIIATINAFESHTIQVRMYSYALRERFNAGQLALLLNIRSFAGALASSKSDRVKLKFAQKVAAFSLDFATPTRLAKVMDRLKSKSKHTAAEDGASGEEPGETLLTGDLLNIILSGYGSAIHEFRLNLRDEYEDLLHELARGQPRDGTKGRPLGSRVPFAIMNEFVAGQFKRDCAVFESFFHSLYVCEHRETSGNLGHDSSSRFSNSTSPLHLREGKSAPMLDLDCVIAIDDAVDLLGFDKRWDRLNQTDVCMVISEDKTALWAQHNVNFSNVGGSKQQYKAELSRIAKRNEREADRRITASHRASVDPSLHLRKEERERSNSFSRAMSAPSSDCFS